jgi:uncharacterized membrane protein YheB (UPF0754 family)
MMLPNVTSLGFWIQPVFYSLHGWIATEMALWLLFHPYKPYYLFGLQLPFTPGIFPRGRHKLSVSIANTITDMLLTREDIRQQAEKLVTEDNLYRAIDSISGSLGKELRDVRHLRRLYKTMETALPPLVHKLTKTSIAHLASQQPDTSSVAKARLLQLAQQLSPQITLNQDQAEFLTGFMFELVLTPDRIRTTLIGLLSEERMAALDKAIRKQGNLWQNIMLRFIDLKQILGAFKTFLQSDPEGANEQLLLAMDQLEMQEKLQARLMQPMALSPGAMVLLTSHGYEIGSHLLVTHQEAVADWLAGVSATATHKLTNAVLSLNLSVLGDDWLPTFKRDTARFLDTYLHNELENMLSKALPAISLNTVIVEKIDRFSAKELEETIQRICSRELRWLALLGAFLGFWLGLVANVLAWFSVR